MLKCIKNSEMFSSLNLNKQLSHAYLLYSNDMALNNEIAFTFAKSFLCKKKSACDECDSCKQINASSHMDFNKIEQASIKVEDVNQIIQKLNTKPFVGEHKIFLLLNAESINEIAQNKLLKSLEEPNKYNIFILTTTKTDKLLPTVMSRLKKVFVPKLEYQDKLLITSELKSNGTDISSLLNNEFTLTEMLNFSLSNELKDTLNSIKYIFSNLNSSSDIPSVASSITIANKQLFLSTLQDLFIHAIKDEKQSKYDEQLILIIKSKFNEKAIIKCIPLFEDSFKKLMSNVNFSYILDNLLFNILKERFLCN